ncbi:MAG: DUF2809 domain-containing protein [Bacteroidales bacterium]|nr:DUF2809 domain-containing protein [Bacteroidales bacterium]
MANFFKNNITTLILIIIIVPIGFYSKFYSGPCKLWINNSLSGVFYELFWCLLIFLFIKKPFQIAILVFLVTCSLEFLQLWHPVFLEKVRSYFIGKILLGNSFVWTDFIYYFFGCFIAYWIMTLVKGR